jgi:hypothetical protein
MSKLDGGEKDFGSSNMRIITALPLVILLAGCDIAVLPGQGDFSKKIAGEYYIHRTSAHQIMIAPLGWSDETPIIPTKVVECDFDSRFVIARQQELQRRSPNDPKDTYAEPALGKFHYWILDAMAPKVYGPFTEEEFTSQRTTLGVPESLILKDVYTFRP